MLFFIIKTSFTWVCVAVNGTYILIYVLAAVENEFLNQMYNLIMKMKKGEQTLCLMSGS